jgi:putative (di)nucleoside polyphosphate hydrolase
VTHTAAWDIPKGMRDPGEDTLEAAMRELREEAGVAFDAARFEDLGEFDYRRDKGLHLYKVEWATSWGPGPAGMHQLLPACKTGKPTLEMDGFRWATREEISRSCAGRGWPSAAVADVVTVSCAACAPLCVLRVRMAPRRRTSMSKHQRHRL